MGILDTRDFTLKRYEKLCEAVIASRYNNVTFKEYFEQEDNSIDDKFSITAERKERLKVIKHYVNKRERFLKNMEFGSKEREKYFERKLGSIKKPTMEDVFKMQREKKGRTNFDDLGLRELEEKASEIGFITKNEYITELIKNNYLELSKSLGKNNLEKGNKVLSELIGHRKILLLNISKLEDTIKKELETKKKDYQQRIKNAQNGVDRIKKMLSERNNHFKKLIDLLK